jgi:hypothetical protein
MNETMEQDGMYALVELMGHQKMVGLVRETKLAGAGFLQVDSLDAEGKFTFSRYLGPSAIYAINPISKELAEELAKKYQPPPVNAFDVPQLRDKIRKEIGVSPEGPGTIYPGDPDEDDERF